MIEIGKNKFVVGTPDGLKSFALQQRIVPVFARVANVFVHLLGVGSDVATLAEMDLTAVLPAALPHIGDIFAEMKPGELEWITRELLRDTKCDGMALFGSPGGDAFSSLMAGRTIDTWKLLWHALEVWYPDFFARARALVVKNGAGVNRSAESNTLQTAGPGPVSA